MPGDSIEVLDIEGRLKYRHNGSSLKGAKLLGLNLAWADFRGKDLAGTDFSKSNLSRSTFDGANLQGAVFDSSIFKMGSFRGADLSDAFFSNTRLYGVDFSDAGLVDAYFGSIEFLYSDFNKANLKGATITKSLFKFCMDLSKAKGLENIKLFDLAIDRVTLKENIAGLPDEFLMNAGYAPREIEALRNLYRDGNFFSCFISHAEQNLSFAEKLLADIRKRNISCWHYKEDLRGGDDWFQQIERAIEGYDKLVVVLSKDSVFRENVVDEILMAIRLERDTDQRKLFPIRLDNFVLSSELMDIAKKNVRNGLWSENWVPIVRARQIPDFAGWETSPDIYDEQIGRLLVDLEKDED